MNKKHCKFFALLIVAVFAVSALAACDLFGGTDKTYDSPKAVVEAYFDAYNEGDLDKTMNCFYFKNESVRTQVKQMHKDAYNQSKQSGMFELTEGKQYIKVGDIDSEIDGNNAVVWVELKIGYSDWDEEDWDYEDWEEEDIPCVKKDGSWYMDAAALFGLEGGLEGEGEFSGEINGKGFNAPVAALEAYVAAGNSGDKAKMLNAMYFKNESEKKNAMEIIGEFEKPDKDNYITIKDAYAEIDGDAAVVYFDYKIGDGHWEEIEVCCIRKNGSWYVDAAAMFGFEDETDDYFKPDFSTPVAVLEAYADAYNNGDGNKMVECIYFASAADKKTMAELLDGIGKPAKDERITIRNAYAEIDGNTAVVCYEYKMGSEAWEDDEINCIRVGGRWYLDLDIDIDFGIEEPYQPVFSTPIAVIDAYIAAINSGDIDKALDCLYCEGDEFKEAARYIITKLIADGTKINNEAGWEMQIDGDHALVLIFMHLDKSVCEEFDCIRINDSWYISEHRTID